MSQWNGQYNGNQYGYNDYRPISWREVVGFLGVVVGIPAVIWGIYKAYQYYMWLTTVYTRPQIWGTVVAVLVLFFVAAAVVWSVTEQVLRWWDGLWYPTSYDTQKTAQTAYNQGNQANTTVPAAKPTTVFYGARNKEKDGIPVGLIAGERTKPPSAAFFGRFAGEERELLGPFEEKYLNYHEDLYWKKQKVANPALSTVSTSEIDSDGPECVQTETKISKWA